MRLTAYTDMPMKQRYDFHMHSLFSDGTDSLEELLANVKKAGIGMFSLTDHDTTAGCLLMAQKLTENDPVFIPGVELSCKYQVEGEDANPLLSGKYHILGYAYQLGSRAIRDLVNYTHEIRMTKMMNRFHYLEDQYLFEFTEQDIEAMGKHANPGRPHFAAMLVEKKYVPTLEEAYEILGLYRGREPAVRPEEAVNAILQSGGIPVLAHGWFGDGGQNLTDDEMEARVAFLKECGLMGLECYYSSFTQKQIRKLLKLSEKYGLFVTAGSDYHGKAKKVLLAETHLADQVVLEPFIQTAMQRLSKP